MTIPASVLRSVAAANDLIPPGAASDYPVSFSNNFSTSGSSWEQHVFQWNNLIHTIRQQLWNMGYSLDEIDRAGVLYDTRVATPRDEYVTLRDFERLTQDDILNRQIIANDIDTSIPYTPPDTPGTPFIKEESSKTIMLVVGLLLALWLLGRK